MRKIGIMVAAFALTALLPAVARADIINLTPADATCTGTKGNAAEELAFAESCGGTFDLTLGYKDNVGGSEEGSFADDYDTTFNGDASGGTIVWTGPDSFSCPTCILVVVDGAGRPIYGFNLGDWDGGIGPGQVITLSGFYPDQGAISHVGIYNGDTGSGGGSPSDVVPEPASLLLLGTGLGLAASRIRNRRRAQVQA